MNEYEEPTVWETAITQLAREYAYPSTPDIAGAIGRSLRTTNAKTRPSQRRAPSWAAGLAVVIALLLLGALAVPQTRAAVLTFIGRIGGIRLFVDDTLPVVPTALPTADTSAPDDDASPTGPATSTPVPLALLVAIPGIPIALDEIRESANFPIWLPPASSELGVPDSAVLHYIANNPIVSVIWDDPNEPGRPVLTLTQTDIPELAYKMIGTDQMTEVTVNDNKGMWILGPHMLQLPIDGGAPNSFIASNVLIWSDARMTYRIEGDIAMTDALRLAESLSPDNVP